MRRCTPPLVFAAAVASCGGGLNPALYPSPDSLYEVSLERYEAGDCGDAVTGFRELTFALPPRDPRLADIRFYLAQCLLDDGQNLEAALEFRRVADEFPQHRRAAEALLGAGDAYADLWERPELDPTYGENAQAVYRELLARYPETPAAAAAQERIAELNDQFAHKMYKTGEFYLRLNAYDSAILYFRDVVASYPRSRHAPRALLKLVEAYEKIGYREERRETCAHLREFYPDLPGVADACPPDAAAP